MLTSQRPTKPDTTTPPAPRPSAVQLRARRSPKLVALGVLLVTLGGLGAAFLFTLNSDQQAVVTMVDDVRRGTVLTREHLGVVEVPGGLGVEALAADELDQLIGEQALSDLPKGAFPLASHVGDDPLPEGQALVGLKLPLGRMPAGDLPAGTVVRVVSIAEGDGSATDATLAAAPLLLEDGSFSVDVLLPADAADDVARLAATDMVALVVTGES